MGSIERAAVAGTAVFGVLAVAAAVAPDALSAASVTVDLLLFGVGIGAFVIAFPRFAARSRYEEVTLPGLFGLSGSAPRVVRVRLLGALALQCVIALATASARPFTSLAFGVLVPVYGIGLTALWAARHGRFEPRSA